MTEEISWESWAARWIGWGFSIGEYQEDQERLSFLCQGCQISIDFRPGTAPGVMDERLEGHRIECKKRPMITVFEVLPNGRASICTDLNPMNAEAEMNKLRMGGSRWRYLRGQAFADGVPSGVACGRWTDTHKHYVFQRLDR